MSEPAETSAPPPRWPWLDRWFEPPWRALLTCVGLAMLMGWAFDLGADQTIGHGVGFFYEHLARDLHIDLPYAWACGYTGSMVCVMFWFEPLALRLNLLRGLAWLAVRSVPFVLFNLNVRHDVALTQAFTLLAWSALAVPVLCGWRSRPWVSVIGGALMAGGAYYVETPVFYYEGAWLRIPALSLPYAAVLLYGTRRLPR